MQKLTNSDLCKIAQMRVNGFTLQEIADKFGVTRQYVSKYLIGLASDRKRKCKKNIFPGLRSWMERNNVSAKMLFEGTGAWGSYPTMFHRLNGKYDFTLKEIKAVLSYTGMTFDEAFGEVETLNGDDLDAE